MRSHRCFLSRKQHCNKATIATSQLRHKHCEIQPSKNNHRGFQWAEWQQYICHFQKAQWGRAVFPEDHEFSSKATQSLNIPQMTFHLRPMWGTQNEHSNKRAHWCGLELLFPSTHLKSVSRSCLEHTTVDVLYFSQDDISVDKRGKSHYGRDISIRRRSPVRFILWATFKCSTVLEPVSKK